jgi:hypothetical protein
LSRRLTARIVVACTGITCQYASTRPQADLQR